MKTTMVMIVLGSNKEEEKEKDKEEEQEIVGMRIVTIVLTHKQIPFLLLLRTFLPSCWDTK